MNLEIDIGNTLLKWRVIQDGVVLNRGHHPTAQLASSMPVEWPDSISQVMVSSVAGPAIAGLVGVYAEARWQLQPRFAVTRSDAAGVINSYQEPSRMGVDRWLAMLAAYNDCYESCCIVDCGSAITVDYVAADGQHEGGYIIPGLRLMSESLQRSTAEVLVDRSIEQFETEPGTHTSAAVAHGINFAFKALQEKVMTSLECDGQQRALYITGGDGRLFYQLCEKGEYCPDLVMDGLRWALD